MASEIKEFGEVSAAITAATGAAFETLRAEPLGGGSINEAWCLEGRSGRYFVKFNDPARLAMFQAEAEGLAELATAAALRVPQVIAVGAGQRAWLVLEQIDFQRATVAGQQLLGEHLAALHRHQAERFGWHRDNTIGATPQPNGWYDEWLVFLRDQRLAFQLRLAERSGASARLLQPGWRLLDHLADFFPGYCPVPSLLHGDLWGGNWAADAQGRPVIFDPAVYYGDREADLAMTELFGGFGRHFYHSYRERWPLDPGYGIRRKLYQLYHILNHYNLFGGAYGQQAQGMIEQLLADIGRA